MHGGRGITSGIAMKAAGSVSAAVIVGPGVHEGFRAVQRCVCRRGAVLGSGVQGRHVEEDHGLSAGGSRSHRGSPHIAVSLQQGVGPHSAAEAASRVSRSAATRSSPGARVRQRRQASSAAADFAWFQCTAACSCRVWQSPSSSKVAARTRGATREAPGRSAPLPGSGSLRPGQEGLHPGVGVLALVAVGGGDTQSLVKAWLLLPQAARPPLDARQDWCKPAQELGPGAVEARPRGSAGSLPRARRRGHERSAAGRLGVCVAARRGRGLDWASAAVVRCGSGQIVRGDSRVSAP